MNNNPRQFPVVAIGASAGGVEALEGFFKGLPPRPDMAFVVVTHLSPTHESVLPGIVAKLTPLQVVTASDGATLEPNCVYVMPANSVLGVKEGRLTLRNLGSRTERKPVDIFFSELAVDLGERAAGVILSGGDADGTLGLKAIKERGGLTLAQTGDGYGPLKPDMPETAISVGFVDLALPVDQMGEKLMQLVHGGNVLQDMVEAGQGEVEDSALLQVLPEIYDILRSQVGHDFSGYKKRTFIRRVLRRMQIVQLDRGEAYVERLRSDPEEVGMLFRDLLINVTSFFRDKDAFASLESYVIPKILQGRSKDDTVRVWVPGCATGEEVYSIAMLMHEAMARLDVVPRIQLFATDIDDRALSVARAARYPHALLENVSAERVERFFVNDGSSYVVSKQVRDLCIFSPHSVIRDPPFSRIDLVSCRNLLIYFGPEVQAQVMPTFHYALKPDGFLFLGSAESVTQFDDLFTPVQKHHRIFLRRSVPTPPLQFPATGASRVVRTTEISLRRGQMGGSEFRGAVDAHVLDRFAPAHVVVNNDGEIVFFSGRTGKYLEMPVGSPTRQLLTLARRDMRLDLRSMLRETLETGRAVHRDGVAVEMEDGRVQMLSLVAEPFRQRPGAEPLTMIVFNDQGPMLSREEAVEQLLANQAGASLQTERDLRDTRERLQSLIEEYETALEELKSSNEELVSVNEELQSTNEELEASKEELQSVNEELHTVNSELSGKVDALDRANSDLVNLFEATDVATVFLDKDLLIRSFTPAVSQVLNIRPGDRGRPVTDLSSRIVLDDIARDIDQVFESGEVVERRAYGGSPTSHYLVRIAPYLDSAMRAAGVVVTFLNVTTLVRSEEKHQMLMAELHHRTRNVLALVQAMALRTLPDGDALQAFFRRLEAISRTQGLLGKATTEQLELADLLRQELDSIPNASGKVSVNGPDVMLSFEAAQTFGLAVHELVTNAVKYGALRVDGGHIDISWSTDTDEDGATTTLLWRERGVHIPVPPKNKGFGRELIERALAHTLRAKTELKFEPDGVSCTITLPRSTGKTVKAVKQES